MIRPFRLWDVALVARLQQDGMSLDLETRLTRSHSPLSTALISRVPFAGDGTCTCIADHKEENGHWLGLAQIRQRWGRPEYLVTFIAPVLTPGGGVHALWQRLLTHLCVTAGENGAQRMYAGLPPEGEEYQVFRHVGFVAYAQEEAYQWAPNPLLPQTEPLPVRHQRERDSWGLQQLYGTVTPRAVQNAEGSAQGQWELSRHVWDTSPQRQGYVWEKSGEIKAAFQIRSNATVHWVRMLLHPDVLDRADALVAATLSRVRPASGQEIYCAVRTYEAGIPAALADYGFQPIGSQTLMVRHCAVRVREPVTQALPALNGHAERAASIQIPQSNVEH